MVNHVQIRYGFIIEDYMDSIYNKQYNETYVNVVLKKYYPEEFRYLRKSESPDFLNGKYGIEVTSFNNKKDFEFRNFFEKIKGKCLSKQDINKLAHFGFDINKKEKDGSNTFSVRSANYGKLCFLIENEIIKCCCRLDFKDSDYGINDMLDAYEKKTEKLNINYKIKEKNILVLFFYDQNNYIINEISEYISQDYVDSIKNKNKELIDKYKNNYCEVILMWLDYFIRIVFLSNTTDIKRINNVDFELFQKQICKILKNNIKNS